MKRRTINGSSISEFPVALFIFLLVILFPLIDLATLFFGVSSVFSATRVAAVEAARAPTLLVDLSPTKLSATNLAKKIASGCSTGGVSIQPADVQVVALQTPIAGGQAQVITPSPDLTIDTAQFTYQLKVTVKGSVKPIVTLSSDILGKIPGVSSPLEVTATSTAAFENTAGLAN